MWISFLCHCVFRYSSLRSRWLLRSECSTALMGWFGIQLDAGSYFGMPDKVFWWRTIAAASGDSLMVYGWEHTPCLWLHKTMHYVLFFPYHTISHKTTHHTGQRHTTSASTTLLWCYYSIRQLSPKFYFCSRTVTVCFQKLLFLEMNRLRPFFVICEQLWEQWHSVCAQRHRKSWKRTTFRLERSEFPKLVGVLMSHFNFI